MEVTQTIQLSKDEMENIEKILGLFDEISDISLCNMLDVLRYCIDNSELIGHHKYKLESDILYIPEIRY